MITTIRGGGTIEHVTPDELRAELRSVMAAESAAERERLRGIKDLQRAALIASPAGTHITLTDGYTPDAGYKWMIRHIGVYLASAGTGQVFLTTDTTSTLGPTAQARPVAVFLTSGQYQAADIGSGACILSEAQGLYLNFSQNVVGYFMSGWIVPAEMVGKLV